MCSRIRVASSLHIGMAPPRPRWQSRRPPRLPSVASPSTLSTRMACVYSAASLRSVAFCLPAPTKKSTSRSRLRRCTSINPLLICVQQTAEGIFLCALHSSSDMHFLSRGGALSFSKLRSRYFVWQKIPSAICAFYRSRVWWIFTTLRQIPSAILQFLPLWTVVSITCRRGFSCAPCIHRAICTFLPLYVYATDKPFLRKVGCGIVPLCRQNNPFDFYLYTPYI